MKPLHDLTVLELTSGYAGALCAQLMCDCGAEVIRLETAQPEEAGPAVGGHNVAYTIVNRGKKSVWMDLNQDKQKDLFFKMIKTADVLVTDRSMEELTALGCSYEALAEENRKLVMTLVSPFGQTGPMKNIASEETCIQALSGVMSMVGDFGSVPVRIGTDVASSSASYFAFVGTMAALLTANETGLGQTVDVAELDSLFAIAEAPIIRYDMAGMVPALCGNRHPSTVPVGDYTCKDGRQLVVNVTTDEQFARFVTALDSPEIVDGDLKYAAERVAQRPLAEKLISEAFAKFDAVEVMRRLEEINAPYGVINDLKDVSETEHIQDHKMIASAVYPDGAKLRCVASPLLMSDAERPETYQVSPPGYDSVCVAERYVSSEEAGAIYPDAFRRVKPAATTVFYGTKDSTV